MKTDGSTIELGREWWNAEDRPGISSRTVALEIKRPKKAAMDSRYFKVTEVAKKLGLNYDTICRKIRSGEIYADPQPKGYLIPDWAVDEYFADSRRKRRTG